MLTKLRSFLILSAKTKILKSISIWGNILGKILENLRFKLRKQYEEDNLYEPFIVLRILENVFTQEDDIKVVFEYIALIKNKEITFNSIIEKYGMKNGGHVSLT